MRLPYHPARALCLLTLAGALLATGPVTAGFINIEAHANRNSVFGTNTFYYYDYRDIGSVSPAPDDPASASSASARFFGNMAHLSCQSAGGITSEFLQSQSISTAQADWVDARHPTDRGGGLAS